MVSIKGLSWTATGPEPVEIEVASERGLPDVAWIGSVPKGLARREHKYRSALLQSGYQWPKRSRFLVQVRPLREGAMVSANGLDLPICVGLLVESGQFAPGGESVRGSREVPVLASGEIDFTGKVRPESHHQLHLPNPFIGGVDEIWIGVRERSVTRDGSDSESGRARVRELRSLHDLRDISELDKVAPAEPTIGEPGFEAKLAWSQEQGRFILVSALSGLHTILGGPPGTGKSTALEAILRLRVALARASGINLPVVQAHHSTTRVQIGGDLRSTRPAAWIQAEGGVLLMDELLHFTAPAIEMLRESLEGVSLSRRVERRENTRPRAAFQLLAATNLCPCGLWDSGDPLGGRCRCSIGRRLRYQSGLTGPIADRIGLWCHWKQEAPEVSWEELMNRARGIFERSDNRAEQAAQGTVLPSEIEDRLREIEASSRRRGRALRSVLTALAKVKGGGLGLVEWGQAQRWTQPMMQE